LRTLVIATYLLFCSLVAVAQQRKEYVFTNFSTSNGLASNIVTSIVQDEKGYMWFSTINGLQRFDGNKFLDFKAIPDDNTSIPTNNLRGLYFDGHKRLWLVGHNNTVGIFNTSHLEYNAVPIQNNRKEKSYLYKHFLETPDGRLFLIEEKGNIYRYNEQADQFVVENNLIQLPANWKHNRITWDGQTRRYWIATDSGLVVYNPATKLLSYRGHNAEQDPVIKRFENETGILNVVMLPNNAIGFYAQANASALPLLYYYNRNSGVATVSNPGKELNLNYYEIHGLLQQKSGNLWTHGVYMFAQWFPEQQQFRPLPNTYQGEQSIKFNYANYSYEDREGDIWIATDNGLFLFNPDAQVFNSFSLIRADEKDVVERGVLSMSIQQTKDGNIWAGTWGRGLFYFDNHFNAIEVPAPIKALQKNFTVWDIHEHSATGKLWFTLENQGNNAMVYDPKTQKVEWVNNSIFGTEPIRQMIEDRDGNIWFGTQGGYLVKWDQKLAQGDVHKGYMLIARTGNIRKLYRDWQGTIWAITNSAGLLKVDPRKNVVLRNFVEDAPKGYELTTNELCDALQFDDSTLIVAAGTVNLINLKNNKVTHITTANGLPSNTAVSILKDKRGVLWFGMTSGLCRVNLKKNIFIPYDRKDGIPYDNFEPNRALALQDGRLVFGTDQNWVVFDPLKAVQSERPSQPMLTTFRLGNKTLPVDSLLQQKEVSLRYNSNSIYIEFSNLHFFRQKKLRYYYRLKDLDNDWILADAGNHAQYNYIPPGHYTFEVKSVNEDGVSSKEFATLTIVVKPPFWKTTWFYALLTLLGLLILFLIDRERIKRLRAVQQMRSQIAGDLHKDIHVTLSDINVLSAMAKIKADKDIVRSKDYIDTISHKSRDMMESMEDILWTLDPENDSMEKMLLRLKEYTAGFKNTHNISIELNSNKNIDKLIMDMRCRHEFLLFYKHALAYMIEQVGCTHIHIALEYIKSKLTLKLQADCLQDSHEKPVLSPSWQEMHKRAEALNASLDITTNKKKAYIFLQLDA
jgi:ligand-binding sensor domain-containing protein